MKEREIKRLKAKAEKIRISANYTDDPNVFRELTREASALDAQAESLKRALAAELDLAPTCHCGSQDFDDDGVCEHCGDDCPECA